MDGHLRIDKYILIEVEKEGGKIITCDIWMSNFVLQTILFSTLIAIL